MCSSSALEEQLIKYSKTKWKGTHKSAHVTHKSAIEEEHLKLNSSKPGALDLLHFRFYNCKKFPVPYCSFFCRRGSERKESATTKSLSSIQILLTFEKRFYLQ